MLKLQTNIPALPCGALAESWRDHRSPYEAQMVGVVPKDIEGHTVEESEMGPYKEL